MKGKKRGEKGYQMEKQIDLDTREIKQHNKTREKEGKKRQDQNNEMERR